MKRIICLILLSLCCCATNAQNAEYEAKQHVIKFYNALTRYAQACKRASSEVSVTSIETEIYGYLHGNSKNIDCPADILDFYNPQRDVRVTLPAHRYLSLLESVAKADRDFSIVYEILPIKNVVSNAVEVPVRVTYTFRKTKYRYIHKVVFLKGYSSSSIEGITSVANPIRKNKDCSNTFGGAISYSSRYTISLEAIATSKSNWIVGIGGGFNCTKSHRIVETMGSTSITRTPSWMVNVIIGYCPIKYISVALEAGLLNENTTQTSSGVLNGAMVYSQKTIGSPHAFLAPKAIGFIPLVDDGDILLSLHCGYDFCFNNRNLWGWRFGAGLQFEL